MPETTLTLTTQTTDAPELEHCTPDPVILRDYQAAAYLHVLASVTLAEQGSLPGNGDVAECR